MINVKQNDRKPAAPAVLKRGDTVVDLTLATSVTFKARLINGVTVDIEGTCTVLDAAAGSIEYRWADGDTAANGTYYAEWEVLWPDGTTETFPTQIHDILIIWPDLDGS